MLTLYQSPPIWELTSSSPFCTKLETYLRMAGVPFRLSEDLNPLKAPKGKIPFIEIDGRLIGDSGLIIEQLEAQRAEALDAWLTPLQKAQALAIRRMLEEHLYFGIGYCRWAEDANWPQVRDAVFGFLPPGLNKLLPALLRPKMLAQIKGQGLGRHTREELYALCIQDIDSLALLIDDKPYVLGERPCTLDASAFAFLTHILWVPFDNPLKRAAAGHANLEAYCRRISAAYYSPAAAPV